MLRKAEHADLDAVTAIYEAIHDEEEAGRSTTGWIRGVYPTRETAEKALRDGELYVLTLEDGTVAASLRLNCSQEPAYALAPWQYPASDADIMVMHTLTVDPRYRGRGLASEALRGYEDFARARGCSVLRIDTNARNTRARGMYAHLGFREAGIIPTEFNGIPGVELVCLEKYIGTEGGSL